MTKKIDFLHLIQRSASPISLNVLMNECPDVSRRTAQRWLGQLIGEGKIQAQGEARARLYVASLVTPDPGEKVDDSFPIYIPLSADSKEVLDYVNQPLQQRKPVGYQREFLDDYQPNKTFYLPATLRNQLHKMGATDQEKFPAGTYGRSILSRLLIDLSWASSHLEGNTYSRLDTHKLMQDGKAADGKTAFETQMILNHKAAIEFLIENAEEVSLNRFSILNLHSALSENLLPNPSDEGRLRQHIVQIGKSVYRPATIPQQIGELFNLILEKVQKINDPFEQSFFMMVHLPYLQPFADVNKRTSRLAANLPLIRENLCPLTFLNVEEKAYSRATLGVYELTRIELLRDLYVWAYEQSVQEYLVVKKDLVEPDPGRLVYRDIIKKIIHDVVINYQKDPLTLIQEILAEKVTDDKRSEVQALIVDELRRLHEGVLARYGLRLSDFAKWQAHQ